MRIHIAIDIRPPRWALIALWTLAVTTLVAIPFTIALADYPYVPQDGQIVSAAGLKQDFDGLDTRISHLEEAGAPASGGSKPVVTVGSQSLSVGAIYKGVTAPTPGDMSGLTASGTGLVKAANACNAVLGSTTAHMCTAEELFRTGEFGLLATMVGTLSSGWFVSWSGSGGANCSGANGWDMYTSQLQQVAGSNLSNGSATCSTSSPVLCCDNP